MGSQTEPQWRHGVICTPRNCRFQVWAPLADRVEVLFTDRPALPLAPVEGGYWSAVAEGAFADLDYRFRLDNGDAWPDPASRHQPQGVHGPSRIADLSFDWTDAAWRAPRLDEYLIYELHIGAFTAAGTFDAVVERLPYLLDLGITAVEIMPVSQCPGARNWGYDGVYPFAVQESYGGPRELQKLVDACHRAGLAVVLDVVYNHWGPEGNYTSKFGPYFSDRYHTPWGSAVNFDSECSPGVREFVIENAVYWVTEFHVDALRLDAVHGIFDQSAYPILEEITDRVHAVKPRAIVIAESDLNDPRLALPKPAGLAMDAQWTDDFHHSVHALLTGERSGYYADFGELKHMARAMRDGYVYQHDYSPHRKRWHGRSPLGLDPEQHIVFSQNHDQVGNRMLGERTSALLEFERLKLAAGAVLLSPFTPLLFMGEEFGETAPFLYFVDHGDPALIEAVRKGRKEEFASFAWKGEPPDPESAETFERAKLHWDLLDQEPHRTLYRYYQQLIRLRKSLPHGEAAVASHEDRGVLEVMRPGAWILLNFSTREVEVAPREEDWNLLLDSAAAEWGGPGHIDGPNPVLQPGSLVMFGGPA